MLSNLICGLVPSLLVVVVFIPLICFFDRHAISFSVACTLCTERSSPDLELASRLMFVEGRLSLSFIAADGFSG